MAANVSGSFLAYPASTPASSRIRRRVVRPMSMPSRSASSSLCSSSGKGVKGGGKVCHVGGSIVGLRQLGGAKLYHRGDA